MYFGEAEESCRAIGMRLCRVADLQHALDAGYSTCTCGWTEDGHARYPVSLEDAQAQDGCGNRDLPRAEVFDCGVHDSYHRMADTYCCVSSLDMLQTPAVESP